MAVKFPPLCSCLKFGAARTLEAHTPIAEKPMPRTCHDPVAHTTHTEAIPLYVAYDISEQRRRVRLHRLLRGFGEPVQESVFLCWVDALRRRRLAALLDDFRRARHTGRERIDCIPARAGAAPEPSYEWVIE